MCACHVMIKRVKGRGFVLGVHDTILTTFFKSVCILTLHLQHLGAQQGMFWDCSTVECDETQHTLKLIQRCHSKIACVPLQCTRHTIGVFRPIPGLIRHAGSRVM